MRHRRALSLAALLSSAALTRVLPAAPHGATHPSTTQAAPTTQALKEAARADRLRNIGSFRSVGPMKLSDAISIKLVEGGRIAVTSPLRTEGDDVFVAIGGADPDICTLRVSELKTAGQSVPAGLSFKRYNFSDPGVVEMETEAIAYPDGRCQIVGTWQYPGEAFRTVTVMDQLPSVDETGNRVAGEFSLRVQEIDDQDSERIKVELRAANLAELQRKHPAEVNAYIRPVFRQLDAESLLGVDDAVAWQVFASEAKADEQTVQKVRALLPKLDAPAFADREDAADQLRKLGTPAVIALMGLDRTKLTHEQNSQIDELLASYGTLPKEQVETLGRQVGFLLDCLASDDPQIRQLALARLQKVTKKPLALDTNADPATRAPQIDRLRKQLLTPPATQARPTE